MKRGNLIGALIVVGLIALAAVIIPNTIWETVEIRTRPRGEALTNPFYVAQRVVEELGATSEWNRALMSPPAADAVLVLHDWNWDFFESRRAALQAWVEAGGRLLIDDSVFGATFAFEDWSGISEIPPEAHSDDPEAESSRPRKPCRELRLTRGSSRSDPGRSQYFGCHLSVRGHLAVSRPAEWLLEDDAGAQVVRMRIGAGSVTWFNGALGGGYPYSDGQILDGENAAIFADAVELRRGDHVVFATEVHHASLLALIWRHGAPAVLLFLLLIGLALWRGSVRFGPLSAPPETARRSLGEQIRGTGRFVFKTSGGRVLHAATVRALAATARRHIHHYDRLPQDERIEAIARIATLDASALAAAMTAGDYRRPADFRQAIVTLETARRRVLAFGTHTDRAAADPQRTQSLSERRYDPSHS